MKTETSDDIIIETISGHYADQISKELQKRLKINFRSGNVLEFKLYKILKSLVKHCDKQIR
jgi:hypothetical protein